MSEVYFFHALETLQCMMERRKGGETGVRHVTMLTGDDVWKAGEFLDVRYQAPGDSGYVRGRITRDP